jgi:hypothetical protein|tara:strand:+ start:2842 stop:3426 length:585 start_codon:yes stop_codon:yes gene_type:complete
VASVIKYTVKEIEAYLRGRPGVDSLDSDCRAALNAISAHHPNVLTVAARLYMLIGMLVKTKDGEPVICNILREAADEFENNYGMHGVRVAYRAFFFSILNSLPSLLDYKIEVVARGKIVNYVDILSEDLHKALQLKNCTLSVKYEPLNPVTRRHDLSLIMLTRVFSRTDLLNIGVPSIGYNTVSELKNKIRGVK